MAQSPFQKAVKSKAKARLAINGPSGSGKTYTALTAAVALKGDGRIALIDTERGSASLYSDRFDFDAAPLDHYSPDNYIKLIDWAEADGYTVIVIDSLSHAWEGEGGILDMHDAAVARQRTPNGFTAWKDVTPKHRRLVDRMLQSTAHIVVTMRSKTEYVQATNDKGRTEIQKIGTAPIQRAGMEYEFTVVADMSVDHKLVISKSRAEIIADAVVDRPSVEFWAKFNDWLTSGVEAPPPPKKIDPVKVRAIIQRLAEYGLGTTNEDGSITVPVSTIQSLCGDDSIERIQDCSYEQIEKLGKLIKGSNSEQLKTIILERMSLA